MSTKQATVLLKVYCKSCVTAKRNIFLIVLMPSMPWDFSTTFWGFGLILRTWRFS